MNYAKMNIANDELTFFGRGQGNDYRWLMGTKADEYGGQAFITEYAAPTRELRVTHPLLQQLAQRFAYVTRLNTVISPEEMTVDPVFDYNPQLKDVSNVRDLSGMTGLYSCERNERRRAEQMAAQREATGTPVALVETASAAASTDDKRRTARPAETSGTGTPSVEKAETVVSAVSTDDQRGHSSPTEAPETGASPVAARGDVAASSDGDELSVGTIVAGVVFGVVGVLVLGGAVYLGVRIGRRRRG